MAPNFLSFQVSISAQEQIDFARDLAVLLKSGVTLNDGIRLLREEVKTAAMKKLLDEVIVGLDRGNTLSSTLQNSSIRLRSVFISMVKAGEVSGSLVNNMTFLADWLDRNLQLKRDIKSVTLYPKIVFTAALMLGTALAIFILPKLVPIFTGMAVELPAITKGVLWTAEFVRDNSLTIVLFVLIFIAFFTLLSRIKFTRRILQYIYLSTPFFGSLIRAYELALYAQLMHVLLKSGLTINESFEIASEESKNIPYQDSFNVVKDKLIKGVSLSESISEFPKLYPANYRSVVLVGEKSGTIESSFESLASYYSKEINIKTKNLPTVLEPILLVSIGLVVGIIALSIILPIYSLSGNLR